jgi:hypothetical protein
VLQELKALVEGEGTSAPVQTCILVSAATSAETLQPDPKRVYTVNRPNGRRAAAEVRANPDKLADTPGYSSPPNVGIGHD